MKASRTLPLKTISSVAVAALLAAFVTTAKADPIGLGSSFSRPRTTPLNEDLTPAEKSRLSAEQLKALARRSLHRMTDGELLNLKKCQEYSHLNPKSCDPMIVAANLAEARSLIAQGLPQSKRAGYENLIKQGLPPKVDAYLADIPVPGASAKPQTEPGKKPRAKPGSAPDKKPGATAAPEKTPEAAGERTTAGAEADKELTEDELRELDKTGMRQKYLDALKIAKDNIKNDPAGVIGVIREWREVAETNKKGPGNLLETYLKTKLSDADRAAFEKSLAAAKTPADRDFVLSAYLAKAAPKIEKGELAKLEKATRKSVCAQLGHEDGIDISPEFKAKLSLDELKGLNLEKTGFDTNKPADKPAATQPSRPQLVSRNDDTKRLNAECLDLEERDRKAGAGGVRANLVAAIDPICKKEEELKDGKCVAKTDKDAMLDVKAGVIGAVGGAVIGLLGGPVGALIGAAVGFALFYAANKALR